MLRKKEVFSIVTPIPGFIPRQLAIDILHSHSEVITLNPLVLSHKPIKAPRDAAADEYYSTWYEITERIQYVPGLGKMGSGKISFNGCFHDMPWGLQTHIYAPMNVDLKNKYRIAGNQPGYEPPEPLEIGLAELGAPKDGLYLHEDIVITCNIAAMGFVKAQLKQAGKEMVKRIIKKAELLDAGVLHAMIEDGKLKTVNPADRSDLDRKNTVSPAQPSPTGGLYQIPRPPMSPGLQYRNSHASMQFARPGSAPQGGYPPVPMGYAQNHPCSNAPAELASSANPTTHAVPMELPGDFYHPQGSPQFQQATSQPSTPGHPPSHSSQPPTPGHPPHRDSGISNITSNSPRSASFSSDASGQYKSPGLDKTFTSELATHKEDELEGKRLQAISQRQHRLAPQQQQIPQQAAYAYNPADYAKVAAQPLPQQGLYYGHQQQPHHRYNYS